MLAFWDVLEAPLYIAASHVLYIVMIMWNLCYKFVFYNIFNDLL